jgi:hypothetical protein
MQECSEALVFYPKHISPILSLKFLTCLKVWLAVRHFEAPEMQTAAWDPGPRKQLETPQFACISCPELCDLLVGAHEVTEMLAKGEATLPYTDLRWSFIRGAAVVGRLQAWLLSRIQRHPSSNEKLVSEDKLLLAVSLATLCAMMTILSGETYSRIQAKNCFSAYREVLAHLCPTVDSTLLLWLHFMGGINEQLLGGKPDWAWFEFQARCQGATWLSTQAILRKYVYVEALGARYLKWVGSQAVSSHGGSLE